MAKAASRSTFTAALEHRVRIRPPALVRQGAAGTLRLEHLSGGGLDTVAAARALVRRHMPIGDAHRAMTRLFDTGEAVVDVPKIEDIGRLTSELNAVGIEVLPS